MAIAIPQKRREESKSGGGLGQLLGGIGTVAGGILAGVYTGGMGAAQGAAAGGAIGSTIGNVADAATSKPPEPQKVVEGVQTTQNDGAMNRRLQESMNNPSNQLLDAGSALERMPPEIQAEYKPVLFNAYKMSKAGSVG